MGRIIYINIDDSSRATACGKAAIHWIAGRLCRLPTSAIGDCPTRHLARPARATIRRIGAALPPTRLRGRRCVNWEALRGLVYRIII